jgi:hypothetical protein
MASLSLAPSIWHGCISLGGQEPQRPSAARAPPAAAPASALLRRSRPSPSNAARLRPLLCVCHCCSCFPWPATACPRRRRTRGCGVLPPEGAPAPNVLLCPCLPSRIHRAFDCNRPIAPRLLVLAGAIARRARTLPSPRLPAPLQWLLRANAARAPASAPPPVRRSCLPFRAAPGPPPHGFWGAASRTDDPDRRWARTLPACPRASSTWRLPPSPPAGRPDPPLASRAVPLPLAQRGALWCPRAPPARPPPACAALAAKWPQPPAAALAPSPAALVVGFSSPPAPRPPPGRAARGGLRAFTIRRRALPRRARRGDPPATRHPGVRAWGHMPHGVLFLPSLCCSSTAPLPRRARLPRTPGRWPPTTQAVRPSCAGAPRRPPSQFSPAPHAVLSSPGSRRPGKGRPRCIRPRAPLPPCPATTGRPLFILPARSLYSRALSVDARRRGAARGTRACCQAGMRAPRLAGEPRTLPACRGASNPFPTRRASVWRQGCRTYP